MGFQKPHAALLPDKTLPFFCLIMTPTVAGTIAQKDYLLAVLFTSVFVAFFLLHFYISLRKHEKPIQKLALNLNTWFLYTVIPLGSIYQLADISMSTMCIVVTLLSINSIHTDSHDDYEWFPFFLIMMKPTLDNAVEKAFAVEQKNHLLMGLFMLVFGCFFMFQIFQTMGKHEKYWTQKLSLNLNLWFFYTVFFLGLVYNQLDNFFPLQYKLIMYAVVLVCSSVMFYVFVSDELVKCWKIWKHGEDEHRLLKNQEDQTSATRIKNCSVPV